MNDKTLNSDDESLRRLLSVAMGAENLRDDEIESLLTSAESSVAPDNEQVRRILAKVNGLLDERSPESLSRVAAESESLHGSGSFRQGRVGEAKLEIVSMNMPVQHSSRVAPIAALFASMVALVSVVVLTSNVPIQRSISRNDEGSYRVNHRQTDLQRRRAQLIAGRYQLTAKPRPEPVVIARIAVGDEISTGEQERRSVTLPDGSMLFVNSGSKVGIATERRVDVTRGEVFVEVAPTFGNVPRHSGAGILATEHRATLPFEVVTPNRTVTALGSKFSVSVEDSGTDVLVTQGKVTVSGVDEVVTAGQELKVTDEAILTAAPVPSAELAWTRDLMAAATGPLVAKSEYSGGALVTVDPNGQSSKLSLRNFHIDVHIEDGFARTTIDQTYFNHTHSRLEGTFHFPLPPDASLSRLAMYVNGKLMEGGMAERDHARNTFEEIKRKMLDPALLEWVDGSTFRMRVFPLEPRQEKRIVLSYSQRLPSSDGQTSYRFPAGHTMDSVRDWSAHVVVKGGAGSEWHSQSHALQAKDEAGDLVLDTASKDALLDRDFVVQVQDTFRSQQNSGERGSLQGSQFSYATAENQQYLMLRLRPELQGEMQRSPHHWIFLFEHAGDRTPLLARTQIEIIRTLLENAEHADTFSIVSASSRATLYAKEPKLCSAENIAVAVKHLEQVPLVGALDLAAGLKLCSESPASSKATAIVHIGSGLPALGERDASKLVAMIPKDARYIGIGVGRRWNQAMMKQGASQTGGLSTQINPDEEIAWRTFDLFSKLHSPRLVNVKVTANVMEPEPVSTVPSPAAKGEKVADRPDEGAAKSQAPLTAAIPSESGSNGQSPSQFLLFSDLIVQGEELAAICRVEEGQPLPKDVTVAAELNGQPWTQSIPVTNVKDHATYLPRHWAKLEIDRLLADNAEQHRDTIVALSKSMYVMSPFTSLLVLENEEMYTQFNIDRGRKDHWALYPCPEKIEVVVENDADVYLPLTVEGLLQTDWGFRQQPGNIRLRSFQYSFGLGIDSDRDGDGDGIAEGVRYDSWFDSRPSIASFSAGRLIAPGVTLDDDNVSNSNGRVRQLTGITDIDGLDARLWDRQEDAEIPGRSWLYFGDSGDHDWVQSSIYDAKVSPPASRPLLVELRNLPNVVVGKALASADNLYAYTEPQIDSNLHGNITFESLQEFGFQIRRINESEFDGPRILIGAEEDPLEPVQQEMSVVRSIFGRSSHWAADAPGADDALVTLPTFQRSSRHSLVINPALFGDLISHAPGLNTLAADAMAMMEAETKQIHELNLPSTVPSPPGKGEKVADRPDEGVASESAESTSGTNAESQNPLTLALSPESVEKGLNKGHIDDSARALIERSRSRGWESITLPGRVGEAGITIHYDGQGRHVWERIVSEGLREHVVCDGSTLFHLYREIGLASKRTFSRFHHHEFSTIVPWLLPSADELARGADITAIDERTIAIVPKVASTVPSPSGKGEKVADRPDEGAAVEDLSSTNAKSQSPLTLTLSPESRVRGQSQNGSLRLVFATDGRLAERQFVEHSSGRILHRIAYDADGTVRILDSDGKELATLNLHRSTAAAPQLVPDLNGLVVLQMPVRTPEVITAKETADQSQAGVQDADLSEDDALSLMLAYAANGNGARMVEIARKRFIDIGDTRDGIYVLLSRFPQALVQAAISTDTTLADTTPGSTQAQGFDLRPPVEGSPLKQFVRQYINWIRDSAPWQPGSGGISEFRIDAPEGSFLHRMATARNLYVHWLTDAATKDLTQAQVQQEVDRMLEFISTCSTLDMGWALMSTMRPRLTTPEHLAAFAKVAERFEQHPQVSLLVRRERIISLLEAGEYDAAMKLFSEWLSVQLEQGIVPSIGQELYDSCVSNNRQQAMNDLLLSNANRLVDSGMLMTLHSLTVQMRELGNTKLADQLITMLLASLDTTKHPDVSLHVIEQLRRIKDPRADRLLDQVMELPMADQLPGLWRFASKLAEESGRKILAVERLEYAIQLEFEVRPTTINIEAVRRDYTDLLAKYDELISAATTREVAPSADLGARIVQAADQWRALDEDDTSACQTASRLLAKLRSNDLAWDYLVTPLAENSGEAAPWINLARTLGSEKQTELADMAWSRAFEFESTNPEILLEHAQLLHTTGREVSARTLLKEVVDGSWQPRFSHVVEQCRILLQSL